jgi:hypothetical protein
LTICDTHVHVYRGPLHCQYQTVPWSKEAAACVCFIKLIFNMNVYSKEVNLIISFLEIKLKFWDRRDRKKPNDSKIILS